MYMKPMAKMMAGRTCQDGDQHGGKRDPGDDMMMSKDAHDDLGDDLRETAAAAPTIEPVISRARGSEADEQRVAATVELTGTECRGPLSSGTEDVLRGGCLTGKRWRRDHSARDGGQMDSSATMDKDDVLQSWRGVDMFLKPLSFRPWLRRHRGALRSLFSLPWLHAPDPGVDEQDSMSTTMLMTMNERATTMTTPHDEHGLVAADAVKDCRAHASRLKMTSMTTAPPMR
jgi:hypothetical protein